MARRDAKATGDGEDRDRQSVGPPRRHRRDPRGAGSPPRRAEAPPVPPPSLATDPDHGDRHADHQEEGRGPLVRRRRRILQGPSAPPSPRRHRPRAAPRHRLRPAIEQEGRVVAQEDQGEGQLVEPDQVASATSTKAGRPPRRPEARPAGSAGGASRAKAEGQAEGHAEDGGEEPDREDRRGPRHHGGRRRRRGRHRRGPAVAKEPTAVTAGCPHEAWPARRPQAGGPGTKEVLGELASGAAVGAVSGVAKAVLPPEKPKSTSKKRAKS